jgi:energy-coupling factor transport system ATP-binding protein
VSLVGMPAGVRASGWGWRHAGRKAWAVRGLDLDIAAGERVLLLGPSGAGKSTLLSGLAGVLGDDEDGSREGELTVGGIPAERARGRAGLVLQDPDSQVILSRVGDDVAFGCENLGVPREEIWARVREALDAVGLDVPLDTPTSRLSGGQKQRLALAGVLAMRPGLLLLDEPTANLDPAGVEEVRDAVGRVLERTGATLVVVEHRVAAWRSVVDRVVVIGEDGVLADGPAGRVLADRGAELARAGVWVPEHPPRVAARRGSPAGVPLLSGRGLSVGRRAAVLSGVDVDVEAGAALAIEGRNGTGKSTLALTLGGLLRPVAGRVRAHPALASGAGEDPLRWTSRELSARIGSVFQVPEHQFLARTVREELELGPLANGAEQAETARRTEELLERLRLGPLAEANPFSLSGGQKRRLSVATALASRPRVLVLDEPTFGQDARTWAEVVRLLGEQLDDGVGVVTATHDLDLVEALRAKRLVLSGVTA